VIVAEGSEGTVFPMVISWVTITWVTISWTILQFSTLVTISSTT